MVLGVKWDAKEVDVGATGDSAAKPLQMCVMMRELRVATTRKSACESVVVVAWMLMLLMVLVDVGHQGKGYMDGPRQALERRRMS